MKKAEKVQKKAGSKTVSPLVMLLALVVFYLGAHSVITHYYSQTAKVEPSHVHTTAVKPAETTIGNDQPTSNDGATSSNSSDNDGASTGSTTTGVLAAVTKPAGVTASTPMANSGSAATPSEGTTGGFGGGDTTGGGATTPPVLVAPTVSITAPAANAAVNGLVTVTANAGDDKAVSMVTFMVDGQQGATSPNAPYSFAWDTTKLANGSHTLTAVATDSDAQSTISAPVVVTVNNAPVVPPTTDPTNLIPNPSLETSATGSTPDSWQNYADPSATTTFTYLPTGHTGSHSLQIQNTAITTGGSDWFYADVPVTAGQSYKFSVWYKSDVATELDAETIVGGVAQYAKMADVAAANDWTQVTTTYIAPVGATSLAIYQVLAHVGTLTTDDYSLTNYTPTPFTSALVSVTFDDGWTNQYDNAFPVMQGLGLPGTYYIISGELTNPDEAGYMTSDQVLALSQAGNEIASHTVHHCDLTGQQTDNPANCPLTISATQIQSELADSKTALEALTGKQVTDFAYPYGAYNASTIATAQADGYLSQRTVTPGLNTKDTLDATQLKMYEVDSNITVAQVEGWIDQAKAANAWLILTYHEVATTPSDPSDALYTTSPADFATEMAYLKASGVSVLPVNQALVAVQAQ